MTLAKSHRQECLCYANRFLTSIIVPACAHRSEAAIVNAFGQLGSSASRTGFSLSHFVYANKIKSDRLKPVLPGQIRGVAYYADQGLNFFAIGRQEFGVRGIHIAQFFL
jgi:hypothetical protein